MNISHYLNLKRFLAGEQVVDAMDEKVGITEYGKVTIPGVPGVGMDAGDGVKPEHAEKCNCGLDHGDEEKNIAPSVVEGDEKTQGVSSQDSGCAYGCCDASPAKKYLDVVAQDETLEQHDKKYHPNGYKEGDTCNKRESMAKEDDADLGSGDTQSGKTGVSSGNKKGSGIMEASDDLTEDEYEEMEKDLLDHIARFEGETCGLTMSFDDIDSRGIAHFSVPCWEEDYGLKKDEDGNWYRRNSILVAGVHDKVDKDMAEFQKHLTEYGLGVKGNLEFDEDKDIEGFSRYDGKDTHYTAIAEYDIDDYEQGLKVTDPEKFQAYKDSFKEGGSRRSELLDLRVKEDREWRASPEYQEHLAELKRRFPGTDWDKV